MSGHYPRIRETGNGIVDALQPLREQSAIVISCLREPPARVLYPIKGTRAEGLYARRAFMFSFLGDVRALVYLAT